MTASVHLFLVASVVSGASGTRTGGNSKAAGRVIASANIRRTPDTAEGRDCVVWFYGSRLTEVRDACKT